MRAKHPGVPTLCIEICKISTDSRVLRNLIYVAFGTHIKQNQMNELCKFIAIWAESKNNNFMQIIHIPVA